MKAWMLDKNSVHMKTRVVCKVWTGATRAAAAVMVLSAAALVSAAQNSPLPVKPGLWEMSVTTARISGLPPEAEARIAALPPAQQAQVRAMMSGRGPGGGKPIVSTTKACLTGQTSLDSLLNQTQQSSGMQCSFTNRQQTAKGASFDISCTGQMGTAKGHSEFHAIDDEHMSGSTHLTMTGSANGTATSMTMDTTSTGKFVAADCGAVKPFSPPAAK
jgi:hypothetical protein